MSLISRETPLEIRARLVTVRTWLAPHIAQGRQWLIAPHSPLTWTALYAWGARLLHTYAGLLTVLVGIVLLLLLLLLLVLPWYAEQRDDKGAVTYPHASLINPILAGLGALFLIYAAIRQARTATEVARAGNRQAEIAGRRHVTDTFGKAVEQLGSDKMEVRIGGIYTLERLAREASPQGTDVTAEEASDLYWAVTENLTAFVRERTQRTEAERSAKPLDQRIAGRRELTEGRNVAVERLGRLRTLEPLH